MSNIAPTGFQASFDELSTPLYDVTFCVLDLETTGGSPADCEITEIGAVKYRHGELLGTFQTLVDPGTTIPPAITYLTGITEAMVCDAPPIETALPSFLEFIGESVIVGHNVRFDLSFLNAACRRLGYAKLPNKTADTASLSRRLIRPEVRNLRLGTLAKHFRSPTTPNHRALEDARATAHVFHALLERAGSLGVTNLEDLMQLPRAKGGAHYSKIGMTDGLPRRPGVYMFKDRHGKVIYVGKASNLRTRVRQYFYGDPRRSIANMLRELQSIEHRVCSSPLEAEITELRLIHAHRPRHNRRSRPPKSSHYLEVTGGRFPRLSVVRKLKPSATAYLGPFRSRKAAELVAQAIWDSTSIRRCNGRPGSRTAPCAPAQMGRSLCPCDGKVSDASYARVIQHLRSGMDHHPQLLLGPLVERMERLAREQRFEEAGWLRDRHDALADALRRRWEWRALQRAGRLEIESPDGNVTVIDHGRLSMDLEGTGQAPLAAFEANTSEPTTSDPTTEVPPSVEVATEAGILWSWLSSTNLRVIDSAGPLCFPLANLQRLAKPRRRAA